MRAIPLLAFVALGAVLIFQPTLLFRRAAHVYKEEYLNSFGFRAVHRFLGAVLILLALTAISATVGKRIASALVPVFVIAWLGALMLGIVSRFDSRLQSWANRRSTDKITPAENRAEIYLSGSIIAAVLLWAVLPELLSAGSAARP